MQVREVTKFMEDQLGFASSWLLAVPCTVRAAFPPACILKIVTAIEILHFKDDSKFAYVHAWVCIGVIAVLSAIAISLFNKKRMLCCT